MRVIRKVIAPLFLAALLLGTSACGSKGKNTCEPAGGIPPCVQNPTTHAEIINACTADDVVKIDKHPVLPLLNADCTLPPLP
jgi:hypothetical protein